MIKIWMESPDIVDIDDDNDGVADTFRVSIGTIQGACIHKARPGWSTNASLPYRVKAPKNSSRSECSRYRFEFRGVT